MDVDETARGVRLIRESWPADSHKYISDTDRRGRVAEFQR